MSTKHIKFSPDIEWMRPFVEEVSDMCNLEKVKRIVAYSVPVSKNSRSDASIVFTKHASRGGTIMLRVMNRVWRDGRYVMEKGYIGEVLYALAHELAHTVEWEHTPEHFQIEHGICVVFGCMMEEHGIKDAYKRLKLLRKRWKRT